MEGAEYLEQFLALGPSNTLAEQVLWAHCSRQLGDEY